MTKRARRLTLIAVIGALLIAATALVLTGLQRSVMYFYAPSDLAQAPPGRPLRLGGLVAEGSVSQDAAGVLWFVVTDGAAEARVRYKGAPPDLFREKQGVVAEGVWADGLFTADRVLAKHDETYMPREVAEALKARGEWRGPDPAGR